MVDWIVRPIINGVHRNSKLCGRAGQTWRDLKVDEEKESRCVSRTTV